MAVVSTPAVVLRSFAYGETSLIFRFYTEELGLVGAMAKGARTRGSKGGGAPATFARGVLTAYVKAGRELHTMKDFAPERVRRSLARDPVRFAAAAVMGEIVLRHSGEEGSPGLFRVLNHGLDRLESVEDDAVIPELLTRAWAVVGEMGYLPGLARCVRCGEPLESDEMARFDLAAGGVRCSRCVEDHRGRRLGPGAREQLRALVKGREVDDLRRPRAHLRLLHDFVSYHLTEGRRLDSFRILFELVE
ncbi:MAG: DNA repair protein RecO [Gemmatimonadota bacterium]